MALVGVCSDVLNGNCIGSLIYQEVYLLPPDSAPMLELLLAGGFDADVAQVGFIGVISLFVAGLTVGMIVNQVRQLRRA